MTKIAATFTAMALVFGAPVAASAAIVNLGSDLGFSYTSTGGSDPAPIPGQLITFIGPTPTLSLAAGTYRITNATGLAGANPDYTAWSYNVGANGWAWAFVAADTSTGAVIKYGEAGYGSSKADVAAQTGVQNFETTFTLAAATTVGFTLRDYYPGDNAGGISLNVQSLSAAPDAVPEPAEWALMLGGLGLAGASLRRSRAAT